MKRLLVLLSLITIIIISGCLKNQENSIFPSSLKDCDKDDYICYQLLVGSGLGDESTCEKINLSNFFGIKNFCFYYVARNSQNPKLCEKILTNNSDIYGRSGEAFNIKILCEVVSSNEPEKCSQLKINNSAFWGDHFKIKCLEDLSQYNMNSTLCNSLDEYHKIGCYSFIAYLSNKASICKSVSDKLESILECNKQFSNLKRNNYPNWVNNIKNKNN